MGGGKKRDEGGGEGKGRGEGGGGRGGEGRRRGHLMINLILYFKHTSNKQTNKQTNMDFLGHACS